MRNLQKLTILLFCFFTVACANVAKGPMYSAEHALKPGQTGVYVFAKDQAFRYVEGGPKLYIDGTLLGELPNNGYFYTQVSPGSHTLSIKYKASVLLTKSIDHVFSLTDHQIKYVEARWEKVSGMQMLSSYVMIPRYEWALREVSAYVGSRSVTQLPLANN